MRLAPVLVVLLAVGCGPSIAVQYQAAVTALERQEEVTKQAENSFRERSNYIVDKMMKAYVLSHTDGQLTAGDIRVIKEGHMPSTQEWIDKSGFYTEAANKFLESLADANSELSKQYDSESTALPQYKEREAEREKLKKAQARVDELESQL